MEEKNLEKNFIIESKQQLPNATGTLVLGILSIVFSCCYGIFGIIMGIIALAISGKSLKMYNENPEMFEGFGNLKAGRICAIIGLSISSVYIILIVIYISLIGTMLTATDIWSQFY